MSNNNYSKLFNRPSLAAVVLAILVGGCGGGGGGGNNGPSGPTDSVRPTVTTMSPAEDSFGSGTNSKLTATFSEAMDPATVNTSMFRLSDGSDPVTGVINYLPGVVTYDSTNRIAVFTPTGGLAPNRRYTATIITGIKDLGNNTINTDFAWCFTTAGADGTAPTVASTFPSNATAAVPTNRKISATFSEEMNVETLTPANFTLRTGTGGGTTVPGAVTYYGRTVVFVPTQVLAANTAYTATISTAATDLAGNPLPGNASWSFTTGATPDNTAPVVNSTFPADRAGGVAIASTINVSFNEAMDPTTITTANFLVTGPGSAPVVGTVVFDPDTNTAIFTRINHTTTPVETHGSTPVSNLEPNTTYNVTLSANVKDMAGNSLANSKVWSFTTGGS